MVELRQQVEHLDQADLVGEVQSLDLRPDGSFVALMGSDANQAVQIWPGLRIAPPRPIRYGKVAALDDGESVLLVDGISRGEVNAWVLTPDGVTEEFCAGDGIEQIFGLSGSRMLVTYFDEGIFGGVEPSQEGAVVLGRNGDLLRGFGRDTGEWMADCYAAVPHGSRSVACFPYTSFSLTVWNIDDGTHDTYPTPEALRGASALTTRGAECFFQGPYGDRHSIFRWVIGDAEATKVGEYQARLRGLAGGRFLAVGTSGYTVVHVDD